MNLHVVATDGAARGILGRPTSQHVNEKLDTVGLLCVVHRLFDAAAESAVRGLTVSP